MKIASLLVPIAALLIAIGFLYYQGRQRPDTSAEYVALGSSFAAGLGLGRRAAGSPLVCQRSVNGYPQQLARMTGLRLSDMSCSGATTSHVLRGGQMFLGPQVDALGPRTRLVTLTAGGNDVAYVGDLVVMAYVRRGGVTGWLAGLFWKGTRHVAERNFDRLKSDLLATLEEIRRRAPQALVFVVTYPAILPPQGTCAQLGIAEEEAVLMRQVAARLAEVTREAARATGVSVVDLDHLSTGHDACRPQAWVNGAASKHGAPFHPNLVGARATAELIKLAFDKAQ